MTRGIGEGMVKGDILAREVLIPGSKPLNLSPYPQCHEDGHISDGQGQVHNVPQCCSLQET